MRFDLNRLTSAREGIYDRVLAEFKVAVPYPEQVREEEVLAVLPFGQKTLTVENGGMVVEGRAIAELDDKNDEMLVAVAAVTVLVEPNRSKYEQESQQEESRKLAMDKS